MKFSVGKQRVPLFTACGEMWEVLMDGKLLCVISGNFGRAVMVAEDLNQEWSKK